MLLRLDTYGRVLSSRPLAERVRAELVASAPLGNERVTIDLANVLSMSASFADELFGKLEALHQQQTVGFSVDILNATPAIERRVDTVRARRLAA